MTPGVHRFEFHPGKKFFEDMESADIRDANLDVALTVDHRADQWDIHFDVKGTVTLLCDRCLDEMSHDVDTTYDLTVKYGPKYCDDSDTLLEIPEGEQTLNVAYMLYDTVALTVPMKHVHPAGQCNKAMSSIYGRHRVHSADESDDEPEDMDFGTCDGDRASGTDTDPRWDALKNFNEDNN